MATKKYKVQTLSSSFSFLVECLQFKRDMLCCGIEQLEVLHTENLFTAANEVADSLAKEGVDEPFAFQGVPV